MKVNPDTGLKFSRVEYYKRQGISIMNRIEEVSKGKLISELAPELERAFWAAYDDNNSYDLAKVYWQLCKLHDSITMD